MVLCIVFSKGRSLTQMDVNNELLHNAVSKDVYMRQPQGFIHQAFHNHVCKLHKALYGLKQTHRTWYHELKSFVVSSGFFNRRSYHSLVVYKNGNVIAFFCIS